MINVSKDFLNEIYEHDNRNYTERVEITLSDSTHITLKNKDLWNNGITIEDAVSGDDYFDVGAAIVNQCTISINNIYDEFSDYDFTDAKVIPYIGLKLADGTTEEIQKGIFTVDEARYSGNIITLVCLDNMWKFDRDYSESTLNYPATILQIVTEACQTCEVNLASTSIPQGDFVVEQNPSDDAVTFREVISWCAQIAGCFARCNTYGELEIKWYNAKFLDYGILDGGNFDDVDSEGFYGNGESVSGGSFNPWTTDGTLDGGTFQELNRFHHIYSNYSLDLSTDDVVVTGVEVIEKTDSVENDYMCSYTVGSPGYIVSIEGNNLIQNGKGDLVAQFLGSSLIGIRFRKANVTHLNDPTIEAGDVAFLTDRKGNSYKILVSSTKFQVGNRQRTISSAETPAKNSATRYSQSTKNYVEYRKGLTKEKNEREEAQEELKDRIDNSPGLYTTEIENPSGGNTFYMHNRQELDDSNIIWRMTAEAWGVSTDGGKTYNAGMTVDGDTIVRILTATGINADWINSGSMSADRINGGTFTAGGSNNTNGVIRILNSSGTEVGRWDNNGINAIAGTIANWTIRNDALFNGIPYTGAQDSDSTGIGSYGGGWAFWAGNGKFSVTQSGDVTANSGSFNSVSINGAQISASKLQNTTTNSGTISGGTYSGGNISGGTLSGSTGGTYVGSCSGSSLNSCSLNGTSLSMGRGTAYINATNDNSARLYGNQNSTLATSGGSFYVGLTGNAYSGGSLSVVGDISAGGNKNRKITTKNFGTRMLSAYETVLPTFSDYGTGILDENGRCYIPIDPIFSEVVNKNYQPTIFLTKLGEGDAWVKKEEIFQDGFWVTGTPGLNFSWESRYKQINCTDERIPEEQISTALPIKQDMQSEAMVEIERSSIDYDSWSNDYLTECNFSSIDYGESGFNYFTNFERSIVA